MGGGSVTAGGEGGGSGGRIKILYHYNVTRISNANLNVSGGNGGRSLTSTAGNNGENGTICIQKIPELENYYSLPGLLSLLLGVVIIRRRRDR